MPAWDQRATPARRCDMSVLPPRSKRARERQLCARSCHSIGFTERSGTDTRSNVDERAWTFSEILGTGSIGFASVKGRELRIGGYGFPISDEGSGADLGLQAVRLALRTHDGRISPSPFLLEVIEKLGSDPVALVAWAEQATAKDYASLAPVALPTQRHVTRLRRRS